MFSGLPLLFRRLFAQPRQRPDDRRCVPRASSLHRSRGEPASGMLGQALRHRHESEDLASGRYVARFEARSIDDIIALGLNSVEEDRRFAAIARISEINADFYKAWMPLLAQAMANEAAAEWMRRASPLRLRFEFFSDRNPLMRGVQAWADLVSADRRPVSADNPFLAWQAILSKEHRGLAQPVPHRSRQHHRSWRQDALRLAIRAGRARHRRRNSRAAPTGGRAARTALRSKPRRAAPAHR